MDLRWIKDTIIRVSLPYLGSSIYCSLHFQMQTMTNMYDETNFPRSFIALLTDGLWRLFKPLFQKTCHYQVHFIKIWTEIRGNSNRYIFLLYIKFCIVIYCVCCHEGYPHHQWKTNFQRSFDSSFLSWKYQYLEELLYEKFLHNQKKKKKKGRDPEQKQPWECNFKLKAISHETGSMILQVEIQENSLYIKKHALPLPTPLWSDC